MAEVGKVHLAIIGGGPGGYVAALRAASLGAKVTVIEADELGGTCLNRGCIPSKILLHATELYDQARNCVEFGILVDNPRFDLPAMVKNMDKIVAQLRKGIELLFKARGVTWLKGKGKLLSPQKILVQTAEGEQIIEADKIIIATGSFVAHPPIPGGDLPGVITSDEILWLEHLPESMVVIGGGAIGLEFGFRAAVLGSKVTIIEMLPQILPTEDAEVATEIARVFRRRGVAIHTSAKVEKITSIDGKMQVHFSDSEKSQTVIGEVVLMAAGRTPNTKDLGLEGLGIEMDRRLIKVNSRMETSLPGIYAIGDVVAGPMLAHKASTEGKIAAENACGASLAMDYRAIPACVYTNPGTASVGLNEAQATAAGKQVKVGKFLFRALGKALTIGERTGFVKLVAEAESGVLLGAQMVGPYVPEIIAECTLAVRLGLPAKDIAETIHAHPTLPEATEEAAEDIFGKAIHK
jgi:dihydrolipoamide dehydrogenase